MVCDKDFAEAFPSVLLIATYVVLREWMQILLIRFDLVLFRGLWRGALLTAAIAAKHVFRGNPLIFEI